MRLRLTAQMNVGPLTRWYLSDSGIVFDLLFGGVPISENGRLVRVIEGTEDQDGDPGDDDGVDLRSVESWCEHHGTCGLLRVGYNHCRAEVLRRVDGRAQVVGCCRRIDWAGGERRCVYHRDHRAEVPVGFYPAACLEHRTGGTFYCVKGGFVDYERFCALRRNEGFQVAPLSMDYEIHGEIEEDPTIRNGHYHVPSGSRVLMCDERGTELLVKHDWPLFKRFRSRDPHEAICWVAGPEWVAEHP